MPEVSSAQNATIQPPSPPKKSFAAQCRSRCTVNIVANVLRIWQQMNWSTHHMKIKKIKEVLGIFYSIFFHCAKFPITQKGNNFMKIEYSTSSNFHWSWYTNLHTGWKTNMWASIGRVAFNWKLVQGPKGLRMEPRPWSWSKHLPTSFQPVLEFY